ncbi:OmpA family protein [Fischerella sp. PCC 9605]|uniref:OmpA family protein n=1 Tax=Fischerella sp. PCC 9605 TaxID=1173024 RepID=UPI000479D723|nr:OmpA family protein [Fischerella sp. PCC 9605]
MRSLISTGLIAVTTISVAGCNFLIQNQSDSNSASKSSSTVTQPFPTKTIQTQQLTTQTNKTQQFRTLKAPTVQFRAAAKFPTAQFPTLKIPEVTVPTIKVQADDKLMILTLPADILFDFDKDNIRPDARQALAQVAQVLTQRYPNNRVQINGHTDTVGNDTYNQNLSERRANAVMRWLGNNHKVAAERMTIEGYGESQPVAPNTKADGTDDPVGRQKNRRVEVVIQK